MQIKQIVIQVLTRLGLENEYDIESIQTDEDEDISLIVRCINMTAANMASCEMPLIKSAQLDSINGLIGYEQFADRVIDVKKIESGVGSLRFKMYPDCIRLEGSGRVEVTYSYLPKYAEFDGKLEISPKATEEVVCLGAMSEYCIINGRYEEGLIYEKRYKSLLKDLCRAKREILLPLRRW